MPSDSLSSFTHVTAEELKTIAKGLKNGKAPGADNIPISNIKKTLDLISDPLLSIINLSLSSGFFPDRLKLSKIIMYNCMFVSALPDPTCNSEKSANGGNKQILLLLLLLLLFLSLNLITLA